MITGVAGNQLAAKLLGRAEAGGYGRSSALAALVNHAGEARALMMALAQVLAGYEECTDRSDWRTVRPHTATGYCFSSAATPWPQSSNAPAASHRSPTRRPASRRPTLWTTPAQLIDPDTGVAVPPPSGAASSPLAPPPSAPDDSGFTPRSAGPGHSRTPLPVALEPLHRSVSSSPSNPLTAPSPTGRPATEDPIPCQDHEPTHLMHCRR